MCIFDKNKIMSNKADKYLKETITEILEEGQWDKEPRTRWADNTPAHSKFVTQKVYQYDISKGEFPINTLRTTALGDVVITWDKHNSVVIINVNGFNKYYEITEKFKDGDTYAFKTRDMTNFLEKVNLIFDVPNDVIYVIAKEGILKSVVDLTKEF